MGRHVGSGTSSQRELLDTRKLFELVARDPSNWQAAAGHLRMAGDLVLADIRRVISDADSGNVSMDAQPVAGRIFVYLMLAGMALENLLKGACITKQPNLIKDGQLVGWEGFGHSLIDLAQMTDMPLAREERRILRHMTTCILWAGRYPVPRSFVKGRGDLPHVWEPEEVKLWLETAPHLVERLFTAAAQQPLSRHEDDRREGWS